MKMHPYTICLDMCCNAEQESKKAKRTVKSNEVKKFIQYLPFLIMRVLLGSWE